MARTRNGSRDRQSLPGLITGHVVTGVDVDGCLVVFVGQPSWAKTILAVATCWIDKAMSSFRQWGQAPTSPANVNDDNDDICGGACSIIIHGQQFACEHAGRFCSMAD